MRFFVFFMFPFFIGKSQNTIKGCVVNQQTNLGIPFVSIGVPGKTIGTVSDENGNFTLTFYETNPNDSLKFANIGYQPHKVLLSSLKLGETNKIPLFLSTVELEEVVIKPKNLKFKKIGNTHYSKNNCTGFVDIGGNWKGSEAAVLFHVDRKVFLEYFAFFIIQNKYTDSLRFRLKFYQKMKNNWVGSSIINKTIIFKVGTQQGEFKLPLSEYNLTLKEDFFISLECLEDELDIRKFCYSGSLKVPSYYKVKAFSKWHSTRGTNQGGGGADFNVLVSYTN